MTTAAESLSFEVMSPPRLEIMPKALHVKYAAAPLAKASHRQTASDTILLPPVTAPVRKVRSDAVINDQKSSRFKRHNLQIISFIAAAAAEAAMYLKAEAENPIRRYPVVDPKNAAGKSTGGAAAVNAVPNGVRPLPIFAPEAISAAAKASSCFTAADIKRDPDLT